MFAPYIAQASEKLNAVVFDHAPVVEAALETIAAYGMDKQVRAVAGDYITDDIGRHYDLFWASATLN